VLLTYEKPVAFEVSPGIVFGGNCPLGCIAVVACCCPNSGWMTLYMFIPYYISEQLDGLEENSADCCNCNCVPSLRSIYNACEFLKSQ